MSAASAGQGLGHRLGSPRSALGRGPVPDLGRDARASARSPTPTASWASICRRATRTCARSPTTRSTSPPAAWSCARRRRRACRPRPSPPTRREHRPARMVLLPPFTPDAMKKLEPRARAIANELIDKFIARGNCDAAVEYAQEIPVRVIAHMLGLPEEDGDLYRKWIKAILEDGITDNSVLMPRGRRDDALLHGPRARAHGEARRRPDQLSAQRPSSTASRWARNTCVGTLRLLLIAGIDTTWSAHRLVHLAPRQDARGPPAPRRGALADADRDRGVPARLRARDHGARGGEGDADQRLHRSSRGRW